MGVKKSNIFFKIKIVFFKTNFKVVKIAYVSGI
jgi:hypothetical protein